MGIGDVLKIIYSVFYLLGGITVFMIGMDILSSNME